MALLRETESGMVRISDGIIASIVQDVIRSKGFENVIWPASKRGKLVRGTDMPDADFVSSFSSEYDDTGVLHLEFGVIVRFGISIRMITRKVSDLILNELRKASFYDPVSIVINIEGVKSRRRIARRSTRAKYFYEAE